jgi:hypothetical protein
MLGISEVDEQLRVRATKLDSYLQIYRVFSAQADCTLTHTSHKDTEQGTIEVSIALDDVTLTH